METKIVCPFIECRVEISSEMLESMGAFTRFILLALNDGCTIDEIDEIIELGKEIIDEEIEHLEKIGFIIVSDGRLMVSEPGKKYISLSNFVSQINSEKITLHINLFNGDVIKVDENIVMSYSRELIDLMNIPTLESLVRREYFYNPDYSNSKEFLFSMLKEQMLHLEKDQIDSLIVQLKDHGGNSKNGKENDIYFSLVADTTELMLNHGNLDEEDSLFIEYQVEEIKLNILNINLNKYRNILPTLQKIDVFDEQLLSSKSEGLLADFEQEKEYNKNSTRYFNTLSGEWEKIVVPNTVGFDKKKCVSIPKMYQQTEVIFESILNDYGIDSREYECAAEKIAEKAIIKKVPFSLFKLY